MALFPRKVNGRYAMLGRQDSENLYMMYSDHLHFWHTTQLLLKPKFPWEFIQLGNCGSPIETDAGWLVLSHGVGPMRKYCIGAFLLDRDDPTKVIGRLREPLIKPNENEREGYVPNVVYSCGSLLRGGQLIIPTRCPTTPPRSPRCRSMKYWPRWNRRGGVIERVTVGSTPGHTDGPWPTVYLSRDDTKETT